MQSLICKQKINWNRSSWQSTWNPLRFNKYNSNNNRKISAGSLNSIHTRFFASQTRGPIPLKKDPKYNSYFGVAHPSYWKPEIKVTITGSSGQIGYNLLGQIASGEVFGKDQPVHIAVLEAWDTDKDSYGVVHELRDGTYPLLRSLQKLATEEGAFDGADYVIMAHSKPATEIEDDTLRKIYHKQEEWERMDVPTRRKMKQIAIDFHNLHASFMQAIHIHNMANFNVKIFVISNPVARICNLVSHFVPRLEEKYITGLSRMHHNRFIAMLAREFQCRPSDIQHACVWGSTTESFIPDVASVTVKGRPIQELVKGDFESWKHHMIDAFVKRETHVQSLMKDSTIVSATSAAIQHLQDWVHGTNGKWTSMVVSSDNHYGIEPGQFASMPVVCENGEYKIVENVQLEPWLEHRLKQHYEAENISCVQDLEDFVGFSKWLIDSTKRDNNQKLISFPSPEEVKTMDEETQKLIRRRISLLNPVEAAIHDRELYPPGFEVTSSTGIKKGAKNKFPDKWSTKGVDLDLVTIVGENLDIPVFTEEDELFMFDYRKSLLQGVEPKEWWPKWMEFKEKTKDSKGLATVYEGVLESLLDIENKLGVKVFTPEIVQEHRKKIEEVRNMSPDMKRVQETFNPLEQALIPESMKDKLPQKMRDVPNVIRPERVKINLQIGDGQQVLEDEFGRKHKLLGIPDQPVVPKEHDMDTLAWLEKHRTAPPMSPYPEKPKEKDQKDVDAERQKMAEEEEERSKRREELEEQEEQEAEKFEEEHPRQQDYKPTFWTREFDKDVDPFSSDPDEKPEDYLAPQHRVWFDIAQQAKAEGITGEVRQEIHLSPEDLAFFKKQLVPKTNIVDLTYIQKGGVPLRNIPEDNEAEKEEEEPK